MGLLLEMPPELEGGQEILQLLPFTRQTLPPVPPIGSSQLMWELETQTCRGQLPLLGLLCSR